MHRKAQQNVRSQADLQAPAKAQTASMTSLPIAWHGTRVETTSLLQAVANNCGCEFGLTGARISTCGAHQMLVDDQRALNRLLFARYLAPRLLREETNGGSGDI
jgi:hypothetical protein